MRPWVLGRVKRAVTGARAPVVRAAPVPEVPAETPEQVVRLRAEVAALRQANTRLRELRNVLAERVQGLSKRLADERRRTQAATARATQRRSTSLADDRLEEFLATAAVSVPAEGLEHHVASVRESAGDERADAYVASLATGGHRALLRHLYAEELLYATSVDPRTGRDRTAFSRGQRDLESAEKRGQHLHEWKRAAVDITDRLLWELLKDDDMGRRVRRVVEVGGAWGATMSHVYARFDPDEYQNYEIDSAYRNWAAAEFGAVPMTVDGETLSATSTGSVDLAIVNNVLQFVPPIKVWSYLEELARVTAVGGVVLFGLVVADDLTAADRRVLMRDLFPRRAFSLVPMAFVRASFPAATFEDISHDTQRYGAQRLRYFLFRRVAPDTD